MLTAIIAIVAYIIGGAVFIAVGTIIGAAALLSAETIIQERANEAAKALPPAPQENEDG